MDLSDEQLERYARHIILREVGGAGQVKLLESKVAVIGAGGLGSPVLMYLAAAGVGTLGIVDDDSVSLSNLQRQIIHATSRIGAPKTGSAAESMAAINPDCDVITHNLRLDAGNADDILAGYDIVVDGCDNFATRLVVSDACVALKKTLVSGAVSMFEGQLATFKPHAGEDLPCYRCFVPNHPGDEDERSCSEQGILGAVTGVIGTLQAVEALKEILDIGESMAGKVMLYDSLSGAFRTIRLPRDMACPSCGVRGA